MYYSTSCVFAVVLVAVVVGGAGGGGDVAVAGQLVVLPDNQCVCVGLHSNIRVLINMQVNV